MQGAKHDSLFAHVSVAHSLLALLARIHDEWWTSPGSSCSKRRPFATWQPKLCDWSCAKRIKGVALQAIEESRRDFVSGVLLGEMANLVEFPKKKRICQASSPVRATCPSCTFPTRRSPVWWHHADLLHVGNVHDGQRRSCCARWRPWAQDCEGEHRPSWVQLAWEGEIFRALSTLCFYPGVALPSSKKSWIE